MIESSKIHFIFWKIIAVPFSVDLKLYILFLEKVYKAWFENNVERENRETRECGAKDGNIDLRLPFICLKTRLQKN